MTTAMPAGAGQETIPASAQHDSRDQSANDAYPFLLGSILLSGIILLVVQYGTMGSLWLDELFIVLNVTTREWNEILRPLAYHQVTPIGFLVATKLGIALLGENEAGLRLFPFACAIASLFLFWRVCARFLEPASRLGAMAIFCWSPTLLWNARNVKQYSGDVMVCLLLVLLALRVQSSRPTVRSVVLTAFAGSFAMLFSQPAVLVGGMLVAVLCLQRFKRGGSKREIGIVASAWLATAGIVTATSLMLSPLDTREFMRAGWSGRGFLPAGPEALVWLPERLADLLGFFVGRFQADTTEEILVAGFFGVLSAIGLVYLTRRDASKAAILCAPVMAGILASAARILPLSGRVSIYMGPILLILAMAAWDQLFALAPRRWKKWKGVFVVGSAAVPAAILLLFIRFPDRREETRPVLEEVRSYWQSGDEIFVPPSVVPAMRFYGKRLGFEEWHQGKPGGRSLRVQLNELDRLRGRPRVWVVFTHTVPCNQTLMRSYLETIGREIMRIDDPYGNTGKSAATAFLYDLSDAERLSRSNPGVFPLPPRVGEHCGYPPDRPWDMARERMGRIGDLLGRL